MPLAALALCAPPLGAQPVVGAKAGVVSFSTGKVYLDNQPASTTGAFPLLKQNGVLRTESGRAEVVLDPCAVLRVDNHSSFRLTDDSVVAPKLELLGGSAVVDIWGAKTNRVVDVRLGSAVIAMAHAGLYRFQVAEAFVKVFAGRATVERSGGKIEVSAGHMLALDAAGPAKFNVKQGDDFDIWGLKRSLAEAGARAPAQKSAPAAGQRVGSDWNSPSPDWDDPCDPHHPCSMAGRVRMRDVSGPGAPPSIRSGCGL